MHTISPATLLAALLTTVACTDDKGDTSDPLETGEPSTATRGLPEGSSTWSGTMQVSTYTLLFDATITNTGGDLEATATFSDDPEAPAGIGTATYTLTGTHEPTSGLVALAPLAWVEEPPSALELLGVTATYDPDTQTMTGLIQDYASGAENSLLGGPFVATLTSGDGAPTTAGDLGAALSAGTHTFTGTLQCTSSVREGEGSFSYDGEGAITDGSLVVGDTGVDTPLGTFLFTGVHNPSTGGLTVVPGLWVDPDHDTLTFFVDGTYDPSTGAFEGDQRTNTNACPPATWHMVIE